MSTTEQSFAEKMKAGKAAKQAKLAGVPSTNLTEEAVPDMTPDPTQRELTMEEVQAFLASRGRTIADAQDEPDPNHRSLREMFEEIEPAKPTDRPVQRTEHESEAIPSDEASDFYKVFVKNPRFRYVHVCTDETIGRGRNDRDPGFYHRLGFRPIPMSREPGVTYVLREYTRTGYIDEEIHPNTIVMACTIERAEQLRIADLRQANPRHDKESDLRDERMTTRKAGVLYEEDRPIRGLDNIGNSLQDEETAARLEKARERALQTPEGARKFALLEKAVMENLDRNDPDSDNLSDE